MSSVTDAIKNKKLTTGRNLDAESSSTPTTATSTSNSGNATNATAKNRPEPKPYGQSKDPITVPKDFDILLGRGKVAFNHHGNRRFRVFVGMHLRRYRECNSRAEKTFVVNDVTEAIHEAGGRFLKPKDKAETIWLQVSQKIAREKVGHALRDALATRLKMSNPPDPPPPMRVARRASDIVMATFRRMSTTDLPQHKPLSQLTPRDLEQMSKSCNDIYDEDQVEDSNHNNRVRRGTEHSVDSDEQTEETETTVATKKVDNLKAATLPSMLQGTTPVSSGEFSAADDASKKWGGKYMQSDDFTVASEIFEESEKDDQLILEMLAKVGNGESDTFGVKRQNSKRNQPPPTSLEFRDSAGIAARRGTFKSCDEISEDFSVMTIDTRVSKMAPPAEEYMSTEFSIASAGWGDTVNEEFGAAASRRRDTDKIHDDNDDVAFSTASSRDLDEFDELAVDL